MKKPVMLSGQSAVIAKADIDRQVKLDGAALNRAVVVNNQPVIDGYGDGYVRNHEPGGEIATGVVHPNVIIFERLYRKLPEDTWFSPTVNPQNPVQFEIGAYQVPNDMDLWLFDYEFSVFRPSGINPGDSVMAGDWHYSGFLGFDLKVGEGHQTNVAYELDPVPTALQRDAFRQRPNLVPTAADFNKAVANSFAAASVGTALLPVRPDTMGPRRGKGPFALVIREGRVLALNCFIFQQITGVVNWVQGTASGYLLKKNVSNALLHGVNPR